jgi:predicted lipoprotein with Yx(FWY)xxD motif
MKSKIAVAAVLTVALVAAGAAMGARQSSSGVLAAKQTSSGGTWVTLHKTKLGKVLATRSGRTLYLYTPDAKNKSNCYTGCAGFWPPLMAKGTLHAGTGVKARFLATTKRRNGKRQVTYRGHPLYQYTGDSRSGQVNGQGYESIWYVVNASGNAVKHAPAGGSTSTPTTTTSPYPGY